MEYVIHEIADDEGNVSFLVADELRKDEVDEFADFEDALNVLSVFNA